MQANWLRRVHELLWVERGEMGRYGQPLRQIGRYLYALARDLVDGQISLRAMSLVYTTLLSLVPLLALAFSLLKGLGVHNTLEPVLQRLLAPLGEQGSVLTDNVITFVENIKVGVLGSLGIVLLLYTVMSMIQKVEDAFNYIWRVATRRRLGQRLGEYFSLLLIGPLAIVLALGLTASALNSSLVLRLSEIQPFGLLFFMTGRLVPYVVIVLLFTFLYAFVPNTPVRLRAAFGGGLLAGFLWQSASMGFASFIANTPNYSAIYSGFAIVILLLFWLYVGWLILLVGCQLAYYLQYPGRLAPNRIAPVLAGRMGEALGLQVVALVGRRFLAGEPAYRLEDLHREIGGVPEHVEHVVGILLHHGVLIESGADGSQLMPRRDLGTLTLAQVWQLLRTGTEPQLRSRDDLAHEVDALLEGAEAGFAQTGGKLTVREWLLPKGKPAP